MKKLDMKWLGHSAVKLSGEKLIYIDPRDVGDNPDKADIILVTHEHFDHYSPEDIKKLTKKGTAIIGSRFVGGQDKSIKILKPGDKITLKGISIEAVPAYNTNKGFHPPSCGQLGYVIEMNKKRIYHSGDTDLIPEMKSIRADIAFLCVSGESVMDAKEAAKAALMIKAKIAVPVHYGDIVGSDDDAELFRKLLAKEKIKVNIMKKTSE